MTKGVAGGRAGGLVGVAVEVAGNKDPIDANAEASKLAEVPGKHGMNLRNARVPGAGAESDDWWAVARNDRCAGLPPPG